MFDPTEPLTISAIVATFGELIGAGIRGAPAPFLDTDPNRADQRKAAVWSAAETWLRQLPGWTRGDLRAALDKYSDTEFGGMWPTTADLKRVHGAGGGLRLSNDAAWASVAPIAHRHIPADELTQLGLTSTQRAAVEDLPDAYSRARMSVSEIAGLRRPFLAACQAAEARAANPTPAKVIPMRPEPPRLAVDNTPTFTDEQLAENRRRVAALISPQRAAPVARAPVDEAELRERAREKAEQLRARFGGQR